MFAVRTLIAFVLTWTTIVLTKEISEQKFEGEQGKDNLTVGDMVLSQKQFDCLYKDGAFKRSGISDAFRKWPGGVIPYTFAPNFPDVIKTRVAAAQQTLMSVSCIKFVPVQRELNYVVISFQPNVCRAEIGYIGKGRQKVELCEFCQVGTIVHELLHTVGFLHMQTAPDRDNYVTINWNNIKPDHKNDFKMVNIGVSMYGVPYDYTSIMHYGRKSHAINQNQDTITPKGPAPADMGHEKSKS